MDIITYALSKKIAAHAISGVQSMSVSGQTLTINTKDSGVLTITFPTPKDGVSVTDIDVNANNQIVFTMSDGTEIISGKIPTVKGDKGDPGFSPTITENADNTDKIYKLDITTADSTFTTPNLKGADGQGGTGGGEENKIDSISVNGVNVAPDENKNVDITVPNIYVGDTEPIDNSMEVWINPSGESSPIEVPIEKIKVNGELQTPVNKVVDITVPEAYDDTDIRTELANKADTDHTHTTVNGHTVESDVPIDAKFTDTVYDDTQVKTQIQAVANGLMDSVGYSADYKTIDIIAKNGEKKSVNVAPIISHASITELSDVDTTNKATGKALVYNATTSKHEYADVSGTDEKVKMDASTDAKYLGELLDNITIANENSELKVKKLDGQEVTITEINYLKGLTMNVMDLVNMFSNGGVKIINTPVATYAELLTLDKSSFIEGISYLVYVLADENHDNAKTTYLVDKNSETPTYFGFADSQRDFTTNPIDLATEITGKLGIANMDSDAIKALFTVDDTYKTETATNNAFSTHGAKALYDELLLAIGNKANNSDLVAHKDDTDIHVSTEDRTKWDSAKTHADSAHAPSNAQANVIETVKVNGTALTPSSKAVNVTVPTKVSELTDGSSYAKKTEIPKTLPANGGNADTVNNHTVETDVPTDAVFTDTVYDDTEVKGSIAELSSNLDGLGYGENGAYNLLDLSKLRTMGFSIEEGNITNIITDTRTNFQFLIRLVKKDGTREYPVKIDILQNGSNDFTFSIPIGCEEMVMYHNGLSADIAISDFNISDIGLKENDTITVHISVSSSNPTVVGGIVIKELAIVKGDTFIGYKPYIPSVKMLAEEVNQQNESLENYGFDNKCTELGQGYGNFANDDNTFVWTEQEGYFVGTKSPIDCNSGDRIKVKFDIIPDNIVVQWNNGTHSRVDGKKELVATAPNGVTKFCAYCSKSDITPQSVGHIGIYVNNGIDILSDNQIEQKMLGWTVPSECPIQNYVDNDGVFHQRVGRMDLGTLNWEYSPSTCLHAYIEGIRDKKAFCTKYIYVQGVPSQGEFTTTWWHYNSHIQVVDSNYTDTTTFKNAMKGVYLYYELAEEKTISVDGNEAVTKVNDSLSVIGKCKNLLNPTLETATTPYGVTCTKNEDGTYTFNGTATEELYFRVAEFNSIINNGKTFKLTGCPNGGSASTYNISLTDTMNTEASAFDYGTGIIKTINTSTKYILYIFIAGGVTVSNLVFKPMITDDLTATYDDFVPYTGDGETLTHDVAKIKNDLAELDEVLLWSNPSSTSVDSTITLNDSYKNYKYIQIEYIPSYSGGMGLDIIKKRVYGDINYIAIKGDNGYKRTITISNSNPLNWTVSNCTDGDISTNDLIPKYIYGIKH